MKGRLLRQMFLAQVQPHAPFANGDAEDNENFQLNEYEEECQIFQKIVKSFRRRKIPCMHWGKVVKPSLLDFLNELNQIKTSIICVAFGYGAVSKPLISQSLPETKPPLGAAWRAFWEGA